MRLENKRKKIVNWILELSYKEKRQEIKWLVEQVIKNDEDVMDCYDCVFMDENETIVFGED